MAIKICLQAGHVNKGGGAPNELATNKRIADRLSSVLRERGFEVYQTDANGYNDPKVTGVDYDLFLALHCDMDYPNDNGSGFSDFPDADLDSNNARSKMISTIINNTYFPEVGITYRSRSNVNTKRYYMWRYLSAKTPCVLLEMGQSIDAHDSVLLSNTDLIANGIAKSLCQVFNITTPQVDNSKSLREEIIRLNTIIEQAKTELATKLADKDKECQQKIDTLNLKFDTFKNYLVKAIQEYK